MGIGTVWALLAGLAAVAAPALPWSVGVGALGCALAAWLLRRRPVASVVVTVLGAAPMVAATTTAGGLPAAIAALLGAVLLLRGRSALPRAVPWAVAVVGAVEALRAALPGLAPLGTWALPLLFTGLAVGGLAIVPARLGPVVLAAGGLWLSALTVRAALVQPTTADQAVEAAERGVLALQEDALLTRPELALAVVRAGAPLPPGLALALADRDLPGLLDAGWDPAGAALASAPRMAAARWLDAHGRGGAALRLLQEGLASPEVAWLYVLFARVQGQGGTADRFLGRARAPAGTAALPGRIELSWAFLTDGERTLDLDAVEQVDQLVFATRGEAYAGLPHLRVSVDGDQALEVEVPEGLATIALPVWLATGPHRVVVRFADDFSAAGGDRNVWVDAVTTAP